MSPKLSCVHGHASISTDHNGITWMNRWYVQTMKESVSRATSLNLQVRKHPIFYHAKGKPYIDGKYSTWIRTWLDYLSFDAAARWGSCFGGFPDVTIELTSAVVIAWSVWPMPCPCFANRPELTLWMDYAHIQTPGLRSVWHLYPWNTFPQVMQTLRWPANEGQCFRRRNCRTSKAILAIVGPRFWKAPLNFEDIVQRWATGM
jgi:hypothetical protein